MSVNSEDVDLSPEWLGVVDDVRVSWKEWLRERGREDYDPEAARLHRSQGTINPETDTRMSDYEEHAYLIDASREDWLAFMAMLLSRGINIESGGK